MKSFNAIRSSFHLLAFPLFSILCLLLLQSCNGKQQPNQIEEASSASELSTTGVDSSIVAANDTAAAQISSTRCRRNRRYCQAPTPAPNPGSTTRQNLIFEAGFEGANFLKGTKINSNGTTSLVDMASGHQYYNAESITQSNIAREGASSVKMQVRKSDPAVSSGWRAELEPQIDDSGEKWYGFSVYFQTPVSGGVWQGENGHFVQWHPDNSGGSASLGLWSYGSGNLLMATNPTGSSSATFTEISTIKYTADTWHDVVFHVKWSTGLVQIWWDGVKVMDKTVGAFTGQYMKLGMNRWNVTEDWVIYYDALRIGNENATYNDVKPGN